MNTLIYDKTFSLNFNMCDLWVWVCVCFFLSPIQNMCMFTRFHGEFANGSLVHSMDRLDVMYSEWVSELYSFKG